MATLDRVIEMQQQNKSDTEIMAQLQNEGISPSEINDSLNQAKIKNAVAPPETQTTPEGMQPSIIPMPQPSPQPQAPAQEIPPTPQPQAPEISPPQPLPPQEAYYQETPQAYPEQDYYAPQGSFDAGTISEIAEQIATEKLENYKSKIGDIVSFKNQIQNKVDDIDDRLKRIENSIQQLQQAVLGKIGEFGESSAMIHKDLDNLHGTVAKLMNPLIDNINEMKKISKK
ncbi:hypothetical protein KAT36_00825 [Candidatus Pacearchaeota archaeon]|nr:hypothetical protein [Candidatus Pacearchaeota archaeon]